VCVCVCVCQTRSKHSHSILANYRPISILPSFSKILEKIVYIRLMNHLETNNILAAEQFGFRTSPPPNKHRLTLLITY